jgi:hypothetical protein
MSSRHCVVACDESGFSGTNLLDPSSEVITHASVHLDSRTAAEYVALIRSRFRYSATEYKSTQLLRQRPALEWLLRTLPGRAHVHLTDKSFFVVTRLVDFLIGDPSYAAGTSLALELRPMALELHRRGPVVFGRARWTALLETFVALMQKRNRSVSGPAVERFFSELEWLRSEQLDLSDLRKARPQLEEVLTKLLDDRSSVPPPLEPLLPALLESVRDRRARRAECAHHVSGRPHQQSPRRSRRRRRAATTRRLHPGGLPHRPPGPAGGSAGRRSAPHLYR